MSAHACIWLANIGALGDGELLRLAASLGDDETARLRRFVRPERRRQFVAGRVLLRHAASLLLGVDARSLLVFERPGQAPLLSLHGAAPAPLFFSLSHSGPWVACAASADVAVGLDVERLDSARDLPALAAQAFGADAAAAMIALPEAAHSAAFYARWSAQEALFKLDAGGVETGAGTPACVAVAHAALSIALCSAVPLAVAPALTALSLAAPFYPGQPKQP
jgi:4'-phosphopantetheinyl transferase